MMTGIELRKFGFMFAVAFAVLAFAQRARPWVAAALAAASLVVLAITFVRPSVLAVPARLWMKLGEAMHRVVSPVVLGVLYALIVVPVGLLRRWLGGDPLNRRYDPSAPTYWIPVEARKRSLDDFRQQF
jgi:hypothetical protein